MMTQLTVEQLKEILNVTHINGTTEQIRGLAIRVGELVRLNGREWVEAHAAELLAQWDMALGQANGAAGK